MSPRSKDPTSTLTIRRRAVAEINRRFNAIKKVITETIVDNNILGNVEADTAARYVFLRDAQKVNEFLAWLRTQTNDEIMQTRFTFENEPGNHWLNVYINIAYKRGAQKTRDTLKRHYGDGIVLPETGILATPAHIERSQLLYTRVYSELKGVVAYMEQDMARVLSDGILKGESIKTIARNLNERVDKIGKTRARIIARTEVVNAHNVATIEEGEWFEERLGEEVKMRWSTALDGRERDTHRSRHMQIYTREKVATLIGEPNCRCSVSAWLSDF